MRIANEWKSEGLLSTTLLEEDSQPTVKTLVGASNIMSLCETDQKFYFKDVEGEDVVIVPDTNKPCLDISSAGRATCIASWSHKTEEAKDFLVRLYSDPQIANLIQYGVKDIDYTISTDGRITLKDEKQIGKPIGSPYTNTLITYSCVGQAADKRKF